MLISLERPFSISHAIDDTTPTPGRFRVLSIRIMPRGTPFNLAGNAVSSPVRWYRGHLLHSREGDCPGSTVSFLALFLSSAVVAQDQDGCASGDWACWDMYPTYAAVPVWSGDAWDSEVDSPVRIYLHSLMP